MRVAGVDVGGTFTDILLLDEATRTARTAKVPSTRTREAAGFLEGLRAAGANPAELGAIIHGTTVGTNALLERKGARCGLITTRGFADVLDMRRRDRPRTWGLRGSYEPIVPRDMRVEVAERTGADGTVVEPVDPDEVTSAALVLRERGAEALVVVFLNAYANDANEQSAVEAARAAWSNHHVAASCEVLAEIREFERTSTAALNGYLQPLVGSYLASLTGDLDAAGFDGRFLVVQSNGGVMSAEQAARMPIRTTLSGPAAGVVAAARSAWEVGLENVITCDMGGTSFDVALVKEGRAQSTQQATIDFGLVVRTPMVEITTIGAGGGSIARVDAGGILRVGPESAGSDPGPACYGRGSDRPTVTDANVALGRIDAERPLGEGLGRLDVEAAREALARHVGDPLGLDADAAAAAVIEVANARLAGAIRLISVERGHDPVHFALMPFGGAGGLHVGALLREVGCPRALIPRFPGITSALGCLLADVRHDYVHTINEPVEGLDVDALSEEMRSTAAAGRRELEAAGVALEAVEIRFEADMAYRGQSHAVPVPLEAGEDSRAPSRKAVARAFAARYEETYGHLLEDIPVRLLTLRTTVVGLRPRLDLAAFAPPEGSTVEDAQLGERQVWTAGQWRTTPVLDRLALPAQAKIEGPCVLQQPDTTILVEPEMHARVDELGNVVLDA